MAFVAGTATLACGGAVARDPLRSRYRRGRRRRGHSAAPAAPCTRRVAAPDVEQLVSKWEGRVKELEHTVAQLEADKQRLQAELDGHEASLHGGASGARAHAAEHEAQVPADGAPGPFRFPTADLPWPLEYVRVIGPGQGEQREACGDWLSLFRNAAPYIASFRGGIAVVHIPAFLLEESQHENFKGLMEDIAFCSLLGLRMVLVTSVEKRLWHRLRDSWGEPGVPRDGAVQVGNRLPGFVIDEHALSVAKQEAGFARVEVEGALSAGFEKRSMSARQDGKAPATAGIFSMRSSVSVVSSTNFFTASPLGVRNGVDYGYAGVVRSVNAELLERHLREGDIVLLTPLGASPSGEIFFVSSESLAASVAQRLCALKLVYVNRGQRLIDVRDRCIIAGVQQHEARALLEHLESADAREYSEAERASEWFHDFTRHLRWLTGAISPKGVRRGHLVGPSPGSLLQEFYTTDGSGTCVAQDLYEGLGPAKLADASRIVALVREAWETRGLLGACPSVESIEVGCDSGEFFVWKRDEAVLGCGQLMAQRAAGAGPSAGLVAELRCLAVAAGPSSMHASALLAYAERAAAEGGASALLAATGGDAEGAARLAARGFRPPAAGEREALPEACRQAAGLLLKPLGAGAAEEASECLAAFTEEQRMWGNCDD